jgi:hypothetical protein
MPKNRRKKHVEMWRKQVMISLSSETLRELDELTQMDADSESVIWISRVRRAKPNRSGTLTALINAAYKRRVRKVPC